MSKLFTGWYYRLGPGLGLSDRRPQQDSDTEKVLVIKRGRAFPLGHPTTRLCLDLLIGALAEQPGHRLVDIGCGTGVICLASAALGVPGVLGLDIAAAAVRATRRNARTNRLASAIRIIQGSTECLQGRFDLVVANLPWDFQMDKATELQRLAVAGGRLILSGFRDNQEEALMERYRESGWTVSRRLVKYFSHPELPPHISFNWAALLLQHGSS